MNDFFSQIKTLLAFWRIIRTGDFWFQSKEVASFENALGKYLGIKYVIGVASGTDALMLALKACGVEAGDEVIVPAVSAFSSAGAVRWIGAVPVFVDVREDGNINPVLIEGAITPKTKAIMVVHLSGKMAEMDATLDIANKHSIFLIEDAAQAIGSKYKGKPIGHYGDIACLSFNPMKILSSYGDGGAVVTRSKELAEKVFMMRTYGALPQEVHFKHPLVGIASRLNVFQTAVLLLRIKNLDADIQDCRNNFFMYGKILQGISDFSLPKISDDYFINGHRFMMLTLERDELREFLKDRGIERLVDHAVPLPYFHVLHMRGYKEGDFPVAEKIAKEALFLPTHGVTPKAESIIVAIKEYLKNHNVDRGA